MITQDFVHEYMSYDPITGHLKWRKGRGRNAAGQRVGYLQTTGHRVVMIDGVVYTTSHVVWLWMTGELPKRMVKHVNGDTMDESWKNLRLAGCDQTVIQGS